MKNRINEVIHAYKENYGPDTERCTKYAKSQKTFVNALKAAALSVDENGIRDSHQNRISKLVLDLWYDAVVQNTMTLKKANNFDAIHEILEKARIKGIGKLTIYDTAIRIAAYKNIYPDKIYIHAGTKIGIKNLIGKTSSKYIFKSDLPKEFQRSEITCAEIENLLCIYKDAFSPSVDENSFRSILEKKCSC